ncbi:MAG: RNA polymerase sigma factor [Planctomycetes bacterium]|nr:RNA polymerase sigma factor [Planctomycetota bacterium]
MTKIEPDKLIEWYEACGPELRLYALQWHNYQMAEDLVQDAFMKLLRQRPSPAQVRPWLFRVVRNSAVSAARRVERRKEVNKTFPQTHGRWFESGSDERLDAKQAQAILETLPSERREIVVLRIWGQLSFREIAELIEKSIPWVHREYRAALALIKGRLEHSSCQTKQA